MKRDMETLVADEHDDEEGDDPRECQDELDNRLRDLYLKATKSLHGEWNLAVAVTAMLRAIKVKDTTRLLSYALMLKARTFSKQRSGATRMSALERAMLAPELPLELALGKNLRVKRGDATGDHVDKNWSIREANKAGVDRAHEFYREAKDIAKEALKGAEPTTTLKEAGLYADDE